VHVEVVPEPTPPQYPAYTNVPSAQRIEEGHAPSVVMHNQLQDLWTCHVCTLDNAADAVRCNACDTPRTRGPEERGDSVILRRAYSDFV